MRQKILITGASGFLGRNLVSRLRKADDHEVLAVSGRGDEGSGIGPLDLTDASKTCMLIKRFSPDIVFHVGAIVDLTRSFEVAKTTAEANIVGTLNLLLALVAKPARTFVFASTEEIYGDGVVPYREDDEPHPPSPYAVTKHTCEHLLRLYAGRSFQTGVALRIGTMYGPHIPPHRFIAQIIDKALNNAEIPLTSGIKKRDYVFVEDVVDAFVAAANMRSASPFMILNIGGGRSIALKDLAAMIITLAQSVSILRLGVIPDRIGESDEWLLDNAKAASYLNWKPKTHIAEGLRKTIDAIKSR